MSKPKSSARRRQPYMSLSPGGAVRVNVVVSNQLMIAFKDLLSRHPVPLEQGLVFNRQELEKLAKVILSSLQQRPDTNAGH